MSLRRSLSKKWLGYVRYSKGAVWWGWEIKKTKDAIFEEIIWESANEWWWSYCGVLLKVVGFDKPNEVVWREDLLIGENGDGSKNLFLSSLITILWPLRSLSYSNFVSHLSLCFLVYLTLHTLHFKT